MKEVLTVIEVTNEKSKAGRDYRKAQCIFHSEEEGVRVGELIVMNPELEISKGQYEAFFKMTVSYDRMITSKLVSLKPYTGVLPGASGGAPQPKAA